jgi:hypothetical protein
MPLSGGFIMLLRCSLSLLTLSVAACGGTVVYDDFSSDGGSVGTSPQPDDGPVVAVGTGGFGATGPNGSGGFGSGGFGTGGFGTGGGFGSGGSSGIIECGGQVCDGSFEECCAQFGMGGPQTFCTDIGTCGGSTFSCSSADSCFDGGVCCVKFQGMMSIESFCDDQCTGGPNGQGIQLCQTSDECLNGEPCQDSMLGFSVCGGFGPP